VVELTLRHVPELATDSGDSQDDFHIASGDKVISNAVGEEWAVDPAGR
jgi:hypothetical protein